MKMTDSKEIWVKAGYETFALLGEKGLLIESLAKKVGISKSSFYHHFADSELFIEILLKHHLHQSRLMADKERQAATIDPELINILIEYKTDLLFNRQLRIGRENKNYNDTLTQSNRIIGDAFVMLWVKDLKLTLSQKQLEGIFELALDNFFLQINSENLRYEWLSTYFANLKRIARNFG